MIVIVFQVHLACESLIHSQCASPTVLKLNDVDDDERDVVLLHDGSSLPLANLAKQLIHQLAWRARLMVANDFCKLRVAKRVAADILWFYHAIGVQFT